MKFKFLLIIPILILSFQFCSAQPGFTGKQHLELDSETADTICLSLTRSGRIVCFKKIIVDTLYIAPDADSNFIYFDNKWISNGDTVYILDSSFYGGEIIGKGLTAVNIDTANILISDLGPTGEPAIIFSINNPGSAKGTGSIYMGEVGNYLLQNYVNSQDSAALYLTFVNGNTEGVIFENISGSNAFKLTEITGADAGNVTTITATNEATKQVNITGESITYQTTNIGNVGNVNFSISNTAEINSAFNFISEANEGISTTQITTNSINGTGEGNWTVNGADSATLNFNAITTHPTKPAFVQFMASGANNPVVEMTILYNANEYDLKLDTAGVNIGNSETSTDWYRLPLTKGPEYSILRRSGTNDLTFTSTAITYTPGGETDSNHLAGAVTYDANYLYLKIEDTTTGSAHLWRRFSLAW